MQKYSEKKKQTNKILMLCLPEQICVPDVKLCKQIVIEEHSALVYETHIYTILHGPEKAGPDECCPPLNSVLKVCIFDYVSATTSSYWFLQIWWVSFVVMISNLFLMDGRLSLQLYIIALCEINQAFSREIRNMWHDQGEWVGCQEYWFWDTG